MLMPIKKIAILANVLSGRVGKQDARQIAEAATRHGYAVSGLRAVRGRPDSALKTLLRGKPDALIAFGGDGTHAAALNLASCPVLPLPGGTLNLLPKALLGDAVWPDLLQDALDRPGFTSIPAGEIEGRRFFLVAQLGGPALFTRSREALRRGLMARALLRARSAFTKMFDHELIVRDIGQDGTVFEDGVTALLVNTANISEVHDETDRLEVAAFTARNLVDAAGIGAWALVDQWRNAGQVEVSQYSEIAVTAAAPIPAILDGEFVRLEKSVRIRSVPEAACIWRAS